MKTPDERALPRFRDPEAAWQAVLDNEGLAKATTSRFVRGLTGQAGYVYGMSQLELYEELLPVAYEALAKAADSYDEEKATLSTYAVTVMRNALRNEVRHLFAQRGYVRDVGVVSLVPLDAVFEDAAWSADNTMEDRIIEKIDARTEITNLLDYIDATDEDRQVAWLWAHNNTEEEIAAVLMLPVNRVHHVLYQRVLKRGRDAAA